MMKALDSDLGKVRRNDGIEAKNRLLDAALVLFADQGFAQTSIREIALKAGVNGASISYYFGDKAGLYRAVFEDPRSKPAPNLTAMDAESATLSDVLQATLRGFTEPLKQGHLVQSCMRLHFREMLEPTGVWQAEIDNQIKPAHMALVQGLCAHLGLTEADDAVHSLAFSIAGLGLILHVGSDVIPAIRPGLVTGSEAINAYADRLLGFALSMVEGEALRRAAPVSSKSKT